MSNDMTDLDPERIRRIESTDSMVEKIANIFELDADERILLSHLVALNELERLLVEMEREQYLDMVRAHQATVERDLREAVLRAKVRARAQDDDE